jgi:hypothetical protein
MDPLVLPVSFPCGHNVCLACVRGLTNKVCPTCRAAFTDAQAANLAVNRVLESFLTAAHPDPLAYQALIQTKLTVAESNLVLQRYKTSTRKFNYWKNLEFLTDIDGVCTLEAYRTHCLNDCLDPPPLEQELLYIAQLHEIPIVIHDGITYLCNPGSNPTLRKILNRFRKLGVPLIQIMSVLRAYDEDLSQILHNTGYMEAPSAAESTTASPELITFLTGLDLIEYDEDDDSDPITMMLDGVVIERNPSIRVIPRNTEAEAEEAEDDDANPNLTTQ